jgi:hypothetical protein
MSNPAGVCAGPRFDVDNIELHVHEAHILSFSSLGSAGYRWSVTVDDPQLVKVERLGTERGYEKFSLIGFAPGETVVHFVQARSFEPGKPPLSAHDVVVRVTD